MWIMIADFERDKNDTVTDKNTGTCSPDFVSGTVLPHLFRLQDDDGNPYYLGLSSSDSSFRPLDDFGKPNAGCTSILYWNHKTAEWEEL